jgi:hypothetical protein
MKKFIITGAALVALAAPAASMASQPATPGGFGTERAANIGTVITGEQWGQETATRHALNSDRNQDWMADNGYLPVESSLMTP